MAFLVRFVIFLLAPAMFIGGSAFARDGGCFFSAIASPPVFTGIAGQTFRTGDGRSWRVVDDRDSIFAVHPGVEVCPSAGRMVFDGHVMAIEPTPIQAFLEPAPASAEPAEPLAELSSSPLQTEWKGSIGCSD